MRRTAILGRAVAPAGRVYKVYLFFRLREIKMLKFAHSVN